MVENDAAQIVEASSPEAGLDLQPLRQAAIQASDDLAYADYRYGLATEAGDIQARNAWKRVRRTAEDRLELAESALAIALIDTPQVRLGLALLRELNANLEREAERIKDLISDLQAFTKAINDVTGVLKTFLPF